jgi:hypothetical protein
MHQGLTTISFTQQVVSMKKFYMGLSLCSVFLLHGCFDNSDNTTKDNTGGSKSSVQMQEGKADESK